MVRLADDERGRVPFAVVGVLLLLGSTAYTTSMATRGPVADERALDRAVADVEASADTALREAVSEAARDAAREPVTDPADTPTGEVLRENSTFRDALRVRIYVAARSHLETAATSRGAVRASASLPETPTPASLRRARHSVTVERASSGTAIRVRFEGVRYVATRDGDEVVNESRAVELTVATPVLSLHDRASRFERRLNASPTEPGLGRRLTARLYPIAWARGYGQYHGLPVENVVANRHVAVATNGAVLEAERAAFGRADPGGARGLRRAHARLFAAELSATTGAPSGVGDRVLAEPNAPRTQTPNVSRVGVAGVPTPSTPTNATAATAANRSLGRMVEGANRSLDDAIRSGYRIHGRLRVRQTTVQSGSRPAPEEPSGGYSLDDTDVDVDATVGPATVELPAVPTDERRVASYGRRVRLTHVVEWEWVDGDDTETTSAAWVSVHRVGVVVTAEPDRRAPGPNRTVEPVFEPGGALDGPNLAGTPPAVERRLVATQGGPDEVAAALARHDPALRLSTTVVGDRPAGVERYVYADLERLRGRLGGVGVPVRRRQVATGRTNPPAALAERLRERRAELVGAPATYDGALDRARVAARAVYLDRTVATLERRASSRRTRVEALDGLLRARTNASLDRVGRQMAARRNATAPERGPLGRGPAGPVVAVPDASPAYLTLESVGGDRAVGLRNESQYYPLAARNQNVFTVPAGDTVDTVASAGGGDGPTLHAAGRTLVAAGRSDGSGALDPERHERLAGETETAVETTRAAADRTLRTETTLSAVERRAATDAALDRWDGTGRRALAAANGSLAAAVADEATTRADGDASRRERRRLESRLVPAVADAAGGEAVPDGLVDETAAAVRAEAASRARERLVSRVDGSGSRAYRRALDAARTSDAPPAPVSGVPVAPVPGYWYVTVNVWDVDVRGSWDRFAVRTRRGVPGETVTYLRDGSTATLDTDGDGDTERLGRDERVAFETGTTVVVAVPPGGRGVGDAGGDADERSPGWAAANDTESRGESG